MIFRKQNFIQYIYIYISKVIIQEGGTCPNTYINKKKKHKITSKDQAPLEVVEVTLVCSQMRRSIFLAQERMIVSIDLVQRPCYCYATSWVPCIHGRSYYHWAHFLGSKWVQLGFHSNAGYIHMRPRPMCRKIWAASKVALVPACKAHSSARSVKAFLYST